MKDWKKVKLGSLLTESKIVSENPDTNRRLRVRLNMLGIEKRPNTNDKEGATKYYIRKAGQFIYGKQNLHKGAFGIIPKELDGFESSSDIPAFDVDESCYPEWIYYFFKKGNFYTKLEGLAKGIGSKRIQPNQIFNLEVFLPKKSEQKEIIDLIKEAEEKYDGILEEIFFQENSIELLRKSILQDAILGKLTESWRKRYPNIDSSEELLERVGLKKRLLIEEGLIREDNSSDNIVKENCSWYIPSSWKTESLNNLFKFIDYRGKTPEKTQTGKRLITAKNIKINYIQDEPVEFISNESYQEWMTRGFPKKGDILFVTEGHTMGYAGLVNMDYEFALAQRTICFQPYLDDFNTDFFFYVILSKQFQNIILDNQTGSAVKGIKASKLKKIPVPVPPPSEQQEIVSIVYNSLKYCQEVEYIVQSNKKQTDQMLHTFLLKILGQEIVPIIDKESTGSIQQNREIKYDSKTTLMELIDLLKVHGKLHAEDLWKMSKHFDSKNIGDSIDKFYADLKEKIEVDKAIKEVENEKGYLKLV